MAATLTYAYTDGDEVRVEDPLLIKTEDEGVDQTDKATGQFQATLDAGTKPYQDAVSGTAEILGTQLEFQVRNASGDVVAVYRFPVICKNILDDDGGVPASAV